jgi:glutamyl-tRNA reductase
MNESSLLSRIILVGVNHKIAPLELRERLAFRPECIAPALQNFVEQVSPQSSAGEKLEAVILSTCNRTELYLFIPEACQLQSLDVLESQACEWLLQTSSRYERKEGEQVQSQSEEERQNLAILSNLLNLQKGEPAVFHLMQVAAGLDSLVMGENEILGQVKQAAELAQQAGTCGPYLSALFRAAIQAGKAVRSETELGRASRSIAAVVATLAAQTFCELDQRTALLIGAGKISSITGRGLIDAGLNCVWVANRTYANAEKLARNLESYAAPRKHHACAVHFDALAEHLQNADIVICSTGAPHIVLHEDTVAQAMQKRQSRPLLIVDLAVPRDVDPCAGQLPGVILTNIDDLQNVVQEHYPLTVEAQQAAQEIVIAAQADFCAWLRTRQCAPLIRALQEKAQAICQQELQHTMRRLPELSPAQQQAMEMMAQSIVNKLLHDPITQIKNQSSQPQIGEDWFRDFFGLQPSNSEQRRS